MDMEKDKDEYLTPQDLAERYRNTVTTKTLANWRSSGTGPPFTKVGGKVLYALTDLQRWEKEQKTAAPRAAAR